jgi:hypothetical protein
VRLQQDAAQGHHVARLGPEQPDALDVLSQSFFAEGDDGLRGASRLVEAARGEVDALVGGLGGQDHRDQQLEWRPVLQLRGGGGSSQLQAGEDRLALGLIHPGWLL